MKFASEAHQKELDKLKSENQALQADNDKELSDAFSLGFAAYLEKFLAADSDYDWAARFPPSAPGFMADFKMKHVVAISKERADLEKRITTELEAIGNKKEAEGEETQGDKNVETAIASPTETAAS